MINYLSIIRRADFNDLYKYGHVYVHNAIPFDGDMAKHKDDDALFESVTAFMNTYEYSTEYLLVHFVKPKYDGTTVEIFIKDVMAVYALDSDSQKSLMTSLDPRICLRVSYWSDKFNNLNKAQALRQAKAGAYNTFEIFNVQPTLRAQAQRFISDDVVKNVFDGLYAGIRPSGEKTLWEYLLRYERHSPYWNDIRGYLLDAIHSFENFKQKNEVNYEVADETDLGYAMDRCGNDLVSVFNTIDQIGEGSYRIQGINYLKLTTVFLMLKAAYREGLTVGKLNAYADIISQAQQNLPELDFAIVACLLGYTLGQNNTYSCYYEIKNLNIFQPYNANATPQIQIVEIPSESLHVAEPEPEQLQHQPVASTGIKDEPEATATIEFPIRMCKKTSKGKWSKAQGSKVLAHDEKELEEYKLKGYEIFNDDPNLLLL